MKIKLLFIILFFSYSISAQTNTPLKKKDHSVNKALNLIKKDVDLRNAGMSFYAIDIITGEVIAEFNENYSVKPASTMKLVTSAAALEVLGADYRFKTIIQYDGFIDEATKTLHGNIYIKGGGDPTLGSKYFDNTKYGQFLKQWTAEIKKLGIDTIKGAIIADASYYSSDMVPPTWSWEDIGNYFGAGPCGLTIYDNMYTIFFNTSSNVGGKTTITKISPDIPGMTFENEVKAANVSDDNSYIFGEPYTYHRKIKGTLPKGKTDYKVGGSMPDPEYFTAYELHNSLIANGVVISKEPTSIRILKDTTYLFTERKTITTTYSPKLSEIIVELNLKSINLFAEHFLVEVSIKKGGGNDVKSATDEMEKFWASKGIDTGGISINDGSGLSYYNYISAKYLVFILQYMKTKSKNFDAFYASLPISGESGTLKSVCKGTPAEGKIHAKSGTIRKVKCYSGYTISASGREIAFACMLNNYNCSSSKAKKKLEDFMVSLVLLDM